MNTQNNNIFLAVFIIGILALGFLMVNSHNNIRVDLDQDENNTITVSGEAEEFVAPDTASVSFSMTRKSKTLSEASDSVNQRVGAMLADLKSEGISEKDIKTTDYSVQPEYDYFERERSFSGYRVTQRVSITIRDLDKVESVLTKIAGYEVDNVSGLSFFVDNDEEIKEELRESAIKDAKKKAKVLESQLGVNLDMIVGYSEGGGGYYPQPYARASFAEDQAFGGVEASIPAGENLIRSQVSITYKIR